MSDRVVGLDIGGTKTVAALVDPAGVVLDRRRAPTPARSGPTAVLDTAARLAADLLPAAGAGPVGVGTAGTVDPATGTIRYATDSLPGWTGTPVAEELAHRLDRPVRVTNDVHAAALGECWVGAGRDSTDVLLVAVGTGLGGAVVRDGRVETGARGGAGAVAHLPVPGAERLRCGCGRYGHLEAVASGTGLAAAYAEETGERLSGRTVAERAAAGEPTAARVVERAGSALGRALAGLVALLDPVTVLVAGGAAGALLPAASTAYTADLPAAWAHVPLRPAGLGEDAVAVGAARLAIHPRA
ncbi:ROK family protein [Micromonospora krabiensis]|uniref:Glucokinase n=1 Tax=Micromonospora krabiensis TaxID=307121 RepID=A0A1C3N199_9ACTN|nr:ROK family protein [Micromonospora krabiensis]SBV26372.1 glucokinase [Micromonospora krabiensis]